MVTTRRTIARTWSRRTLVWIVAIFTCFLFYAATEGDAYAAHTPALNCESKAFEASYDNAWSLIHRSVSGESWFGSGSDTTFIYLQEFIQVLGDGTAALATSDLPPACSEGPDSSIPFALSSRSVLPGTTVTLSALAPPDSSDLQLVKSHVVYVTFSNGALKIYKLLPVTVRVDGSWSVSFVVPKGAQPSITGIGVDFGTPPSLRTGTVLASADRILTPSQAFASLKHTLVNLAVAGASIVLLAFPSELFNRTYLENYDDIAAWWRRRLPQFNSLKKRADDEDELAPSAVTRRRWVFGGVIAVGALLGGLLDPSFGLNQRSVLTYLALCLSLVAIVAVPGIAEYVYRRRCQLGKSFLLKAVPTGLLVALLCLLVSRLARFEPGYLYGVVSVMLFTSPITSDEEGRVAAITLLATIGLALLAWWAVTPFDDSLAHPVLSWNSFAYDLTSTVFLVSIVAAVIGSLPIQILPGGKLFAWRKDVWCAVTAVTFFVLYEVYINGYQSPYTKAAVITTVVLFVLFGAGSLLFYDHFRRKRNWATSQVSDPVEDSPVGSI